MTRSSRPRCRSRVRPATSGAVLLEQSSDPILTLTNQALVRLMSLTVLASVVVALGLLGYAAWLSLRVRRLAHAAETALGPRGEIRVTMPGATATDEIGDLARSFAQLLARLREHTDYLRTLVGQALARAAHAARGRHHVARQPRARAAHGRRRTSISAVCVKVPTGSTQSSPR